MKLKTQLKTKDAAIRVRPGTRSDLSAIAKLIRGLAKYERLSGECHVTPKALLRDGFGRHRYFETLLAVRGTGSKERPIGYALYFFTYSTFAPGPTMYLEDLFVPKGERRAGIGQALLRELAKTAVKRNCCRMQWAVLDWNQPAIDFYRTLGAKLHKEWISTVLEPAPLRRLAGLPAGHP
jgi:GNAT superfamily N-acetyltransferase